MIFVRVLLCAFSINFLFLLFVCNYKLFMLLIDVPKIMYVFIYSVLIYFMLLQASVSLSIIN